MLQKGCKNLQRISKILGKKIGLFFIAYQNLTGRGC